MDKGRVLDQVVAVTGWSRDNAPPPADCVREDQARRRLVAKRPRKPRALKYSYDAVKVLPKVWAVSGGQCGK